MKSVDIGYSQIGHIEKDTVDPTLRKDGKHYENRICKSFNNRAKY